MYARTHLQVVTLKPLPRPTAQLEKNSLSPRMPPVDPSSPTPTAQREVVQIPLCQPSALPPTAPHSLSLRFAPENTSQEGAGFLLPEGFALEGQPLQQTRAVPREKLPKYTSLERARGAVTSVSIVDGEHGRLTVQLRNTVVSILKEKAPGQERWGCMGSQQMTWHERS